MADTGPPEPIKQENIKVVRTTDPQTGYVVTKYVNASGEEVGLPQTFHLQGASARFSPPPSWPRPARSAPPIPSARGAKIALAVLIEARRYRTVSRALIRAHGQKDATRFLGLSAAKPRLRVTIVRP